MSFQIVSTGIVEKLPCNSEKYGLGPINCTKDFVKYFPVAVKACYDEQKALYDELFDGTPEEVIDDYIINFPGSEPTCIFTWNDECFEYGYAIYYEMLAKLEEN